MAYAMATGAYRAAGTQGLALPRDFATNRPLVVSYRVLKTQLALLDRQERAQYGRALSYEFLWERRQGAPRWSDLARNADAVPQMFYDVGFAAFADHFVRDALLESTQYRSYRPEDFGSRTQEHLEPLSAMDDDAPFTVTGAVPLVLMVDERLRGKRPLPRSWADLLDPSWHGAVTIDNLRFYENNPACLALYHLLGQQALLDLLGSIPESAGNLATCINISSNRIAAHITALPFAHCCAHVPYIRIIVPAEGALATPVLCLAKRQLDAVGQNVLSFFFGQRWATLCARNRMPACTALDGEAKAAGGPRLYWPGWRKLESFDFGAFNSLVRGQLGAHPVAGVTVA